MASIITELIKLRRSLSWAVVVIIPVTLVLVSTVTTVLYDDTFTLDWNLLWIRGGAFYSMVFLPVAVGILASLVWRVEHKGSNWNALMGSSVPTWRIMTGKVIAIICLTAAMQAVLLSAIIAVGKAAGLEGMLPGRFWATAALLVLACAPVAALQSALSTFLRSFAAPVAVALVGAGVSALAIIIKLPAEYVSPYALVTRVGQMGTSLTAGDSSSFTAMGVTPGTIGLVASISVVMTVVILGLSSVLLDRKDTRA